MPPRPHSNPCPQCSQPLQRVRRTNADVSLPDQHGTRRYRCMGGPCGWEGLLTLRASSRDVPVPAASDAAALAPDAAPRHWLALLLGAAAAVLVPLAMVLMMGVGKWAERHGREALPLGESHDGRAVTAQHPLQTWVAVADRRAIDDQSPPLALREGCAWGQPGRNPYKGTTAQALRLARLPPEVVRQIVHMRETGAVTDRLEIRTGSIRTVKDQRAFNPRSFAMTFGRTLCVDARVNFPAGHVERADLYEARDAQGRMHAVMVPDVCGNVSVLGAGDERVGKRRLRSAMAEQGGPVAWTVAHALAVPEAGAAGASDGPAAGAAAGDSSAPGADTLDADGETTAMRGVAGAGSAGAGQPVGGQAQPAALRSGAARGPTPLPGGPVASPPPGDGSWTKRVVRVVGRFVEEGELPGGGGTTPRGTVTNEVPEPGTLVMVLGALAALALARRRLPCRFRRRGQPLSRPGPSCRPCASSSSSGRRPSSSSSSSASARTG